MNNQEPLETAKELFQKCLDLLGKKAKLFLKN